MVKKISRTESFERFIERTIGPRSGRRPNITHETAVRLLPLLGAYGINGEVEFALHELTARKPGSFNFVAQCLRTTADFEGVESITFRMALAGQKSGSWITTREFTVMSDLNMISVPGGHSMTSMMNPHYVGLFDTRQLEAIQDARRERRQHGSGQRGIPIGISVAQTELTRFIEPRESDAIKPVVRHLREQARDDWRR